MLLSICFIPHMPVGIRPPATLCTHPSVVECCAAQLKRFLNALQLAAGWHAQLHVARGHPGRLKQHSGRTAHEGMCVCHEQMHVLTVVTQAASGMIAGVTVAQLQKVPPWT